jgi:predicted CoA-binding protein
MQEDIVNEAAAERARAAGLQVVMNLCIKKEHERRAVQAAEGRNQVNAGPAVGA